MPKSKINITVPGVIAGGLLAAPLFLSVGLLITLLSYSYKLLPSVSLDIGAGLLAGHLAFIGWAKFRRRPATWTPFFGALGAFVAFALAWGAVMTVNALLPDSSGDPMMDSLQLSARTLIGHGIPVILPLMGISRTLVELE